MDKIQNFYEKTKDAQPHDNVKKINEMIEKKGIAIDLGCGSGRDTIFLLKNNWKVISIDRADTKTIIEERLNEKEMKNLSFMCQNFENIKLQPCDLLVSNFSIPFCSKNYFKDFWTEIQKNINKGRIFCWEFLWIKRFLGNNKRKNGFFI